MNIWSLTKWDTPEELYWTQNDALAALQGTRALEEDPVNRDAWSVRSHEMPDYAPDFVLRRMQELERLHQWHVAITWALMYFDEWDDLRPRVLDKAEELYEERQKEWDNGNA